MGLKRIHSFLVHPAKHAEEQPKISGTTVPLQGALYTMLSHLFDRAPAECNIEIVFQPDENGKQRNDCRDALIAYIEAPTVERGRVIAARLQAATTHRSGLGLVFLLKGESCGKHQFMISRFPADQGILAEENARSLTVQFIERIFMKSAYAYKSALYVSDSLARGFWKGRAIDRQITGPRELSDYWIRDFLQSELLTTGPAGTRRLALALVAAVRAAKDLQIRQELISMAGILRGRDGMVLSVNQLVRDLALSGDAVRQLMEKFSRQDLMEETFHFDREEFERHAYYRAVELDNGGLMIAEDSHFADIFQSELLDETEKKMRYITEGCIVDEKLRKRK